MKWALLLIFVTVYLSRASWGYAEGGGVWPHFLYMWQHASLIHLTANWISLCTFYRALRPGFPRAFLWGVAYLCAVGASFLSAGKIATVGASGMACAWVGIYIAEGLIGGVNRQNRCRYALWLSVTLFSIAGSSLWSWVNGWNHIFTLVGGITATGIWRVGKWIFSKF